MNGLQGIIQTLWKHTLSAMRVPRRNMGLETVADRQSKMGFASRLCSLLHCRELEVQGLACRLCRPLGFMTSRYRVSSAGFVAFQGLKGYVIEMACMLLTSRL